MSDKFVTTFSDALPERRSIFSGDRSGALAKASEHRQKWPDDHVIVWHLPEGKEDVRANYTPIFDEGGRWKRTECRISA